MPTIDSSLSTLAEIIITVRRLTNRPSQSQITDDEIKKYVNKFILYDFPAILNALPLIKTLDFYLDAYIDTYGDSTDTNSPFYNFNNKFLTIKSPVYVAGSNMAYYEDVELFNTQSLITVSTTSIGTGTGIATVYSGTLTNIPIQRNTVLFSSIDATNNGVAIKDNPLAGPNHDATLIDVSNNVIVGTFNYVTGIYSFTCTAGLGEDVSLQAVTYQAAKPTSVLYYDGNFKFYPIPDQPYRASVQVLQRPTEFLNTTDAPAYGQWAEFISYGASIKILQQSRDEEGANALMPEFKNQEVLVRRKAIAQQADYKTPTIYDSPMPYVDGTGWYFNF